ncbi:MAG: MFS transporter [Dehalococcoidia bacterium]|nr:MFS transporter [Dehalococcoidia bacterium]
MAKASSLPGDAPSHNQLASTLRTRASDAARPASPPDTAAAEQAAERIVVDHTVSAPEKGGIKTFRSLRHRNYRLLWFGTLFSSSGQWIQQATLGWLVYDMTGSGVLLGAVNGVRSLPLLALGPFGGVAADRFDKKYLMLSTQVFLMLTTALFATLIVTGLIEVWHIFVFSAFTGIGWAFNMPVRQSIVPNVVPREDMMNAMALNSAGFNITRIVGPALAGLMIAKIGPGENFYVQALAYLGVAATVVQLRLPEIASAGKSSSVLANLSEGAKYVWGHPTLRTQMALALIPVVIALPYIALLPILAKDTLGQGPGGFGMLMAAPGLGAVAATLVIASLANVERKGLLLFGAVFLLGLSLVLVGLSRSFPLTLLLLVLVGATQMAYMTTNQTVLQLTTPDVYRGRVMGIYMLNQGLLPLGALFAGGLADLFSAPVAFCVMGATVSILAVVFFVRAPSIRQIAV